MPEQLLNESTWTFINSFAPWLAGIGSILAVIGALYLARRNDEIRLKMKATVGTVFGYIPNKPPYEEEVVHISITNLGRRTAIVDKVYFKCGFFKKQYMILMPSAHSQSSRIPTRLNDGGAASYIYNLNDFDPNFTSMATMYLNGFPLWLKALSLKACVHTSIERNYVSRLSKELRLRFLNRARELAKNNVGKEDK